MPVLVAAVVLGERPDPWAWVGIVLALPALWSVAGGGTGPVHARGAALADGLLASLGIAL